MSNPTSSLAQLGSWPGVLSRLVAGDRLSSGEASCVLGEILAGRATPAQVAALLVLLRSRGESVAELTGFVDAMAVAAVPMPFIDDDLRASLVDTCGTGGDRSGTINVSTMAALVLAAGGVAVCKHGNRAASSRAGSADVLEELGVAIDLGARGVTACLREANIGFCLAPRFHPGFRHVGAVRKELGIGTAFNFLGPLANPAAVTRQIVGVSDPSVAPLMLGVLNARGATRSMVLYGHDGLDELTTTTTSTVHELINGDVRTYEIDPLDFGIARSQPGALEGGDSAENAERIRRVLGGEASAQADIVMLNAAAGFVVAGMHENIADGLDVARQILQQGKALETLQQLVAVSNRESATEAADNPA